MGGKTARYRVSHVGSAAIFLLAFLLLAGGRASGGPVTNPSGHWDTATTGWYKANGGTPASPYVIATADDLAGLAKLCDGGNDFAYKYFVLANDIDLGGREWEPIGWFMAAAKQYKIPFNGYFDGRGHVIRGLRISNLLDHDPGLFANIGTGGMVSNLRLEDVRVTITLGGSTGAGGLVAFHDGYIENCVVSGDFIADGSRIYAGPVACIVGWGTIRNAITFGRVESHSPDGPTYAGGIAGYDRDGGNVENCVAAVTSIEAYMDAGGIIGGNGGDGPLYNNVSLAGSVSAQYAAGITALGTTGQNNYWLKAYSSQPPYAGGYGGNTDTAGRVEDPAQLPVVSALPFLERKVYAGRTVDLSATLYPIGGNESGLVFKWSTTNTSRATVSGSGSSATVTGVSPGTATIYLVMSNPNWAGSYKKVELSSFVTVLAQTRPSKPENVTATPGDGAVTLNWSPPADDGGNEVTGYEVSRGNGAWGASSGETSHTFDGLTNGTAYSFHVRAVNAVGASDTETANAAPSATKTAPGKPRGLSAATDDGRATLAWSAPESDGGSEVTGYEVSKDSGATWYNADEGFSYTFAGLDNGTAYTLQVRAVNDIGQGEPESVTATPITIATAPRNLAAAPGDGSISLTWAAPEDDGGSAVTGYKVSLDDGEWAAADRNTSHTFSGLKNGKSYTLRVLAANAAGDGMVASAQARLPNPGGASEGDDEELAGEGEETNNEDTVNTDSNGEGQTNGEDEENEGNASASGGAAMDTVSSETVKEGDAAQIANTARLPERALVPDEDGNLAFDAGEALVIAQETWPAERVESVNPLPLKAAVVKSSGGIAALEFTVKGSRLFASRPDDITVLKVKGGTAGDSFARATPGTGYADRTFTLRKGGRPHVGPISPDDTYTLVLFVKDGGAFDLDRTPGKVLDPAVIVKKSAKISDGQETPGGSKSAEKSSGGCGSGTFGAAALAALAFAIARRGRK
jgi:hypothetical protein